MSNQRAQINQVLSRVKIYSKAGHLYLVAQLPTATGETKRTWLALHVKDSPEGLAFAKMQAFELEIDLTYGRYRPPDTSQPKKKWQTIASLVAAFGKDYRLKRQIQDQTWEQHWLAVFRLLPQQQPLTEQAVMAVFKTSKPDTRQRKQQAQKLQALCDFAGLDIDLKPYQGKYGRRKTKPLVLPSDNELVSLIDAIPNPIWRCWIGLMATYGLRAHEPAFVQFNDDEANSIRVLEGKTDSRDFVPPLLPEWVERWDLRGELPRLKWKTYRDLTQRVTQQFRRYAIPFPTRTLRYCWLVRATVSYRYPVSAVAKWAGHSETILLEIYSRYISNDLHARVYQEGLRHKRDNQGCS